ncbi:1,4-alpha-glucan branching protein GlgB [Lactobacillus delbrueckii]|uniref:1,4-alpha-glucan branching protein GlgB n=1 Tax=Lactobacillus delbrueckii TaxID=1584 RepID=UPI0004AC3B83|nr:1,4-alpha-glucan branching protein GlgB [Lactobacillus delbrueckii]MCD5515398.1 1,4-alpha-glucan branching protein GlgB [Lactobacillus delbrueckii subsp. lactis]MCD5521252.1 1,4-alpha-glucan branching protein GlgB [Lactobacillus delbrueckii subsp. lactis]MCT3484768.1 1,4-alpha-glucan branching protein GlgB [Lactobacillus delbrueckii subsp. lactis]MCT3489164.1 1,4-alpha-glucan branching protein GlgB [Lactobacillus delbrueckii subsp. lactis]CDR81432.1 1,4-alpha-glucan-branching enzyme [Lactob
MDELDQHLQNFAAGNELYLQNYLGCHAAGNGYAFRVWAPKAQQVWLVGDFNNWEKNLPMQQNAYGIWSIETDRAQPGQLYKFLVKQADGEEVMKFDPMALEYERRPGNAAVVSNLPEKRWTDGAWFGWHKRSNHFARPINIYEVHASSWKQHEDGSLYTLRDLQKELIPYVKEQGFNYIEFMPLTAHPLDASWGYQTTGYFALERAYGEPRDLQDFVEVCHKENIGVLADWVPGHFCINSDALAYYDGTPCYEFEEGWRAQNKGWGALNFDLGKPQVQSFLLSSALFWLEYYHLDGFRVDAVSNMLYRDYDRGPGEWKPDRYGGNRNIEGIEFLHKFNKTIKGMHPERILIAEESSSQVKITGRVEDRGLGFDYKWNMGWMNDELRFYSMDPYFRKDNFDLSTFSFMYRMSENFILPLSHDEVVHGKHSLMNKMFGDRPDQFAQLRNLNTMLMTYPGKKLLFMGGEFGQYLEWRYQEGLEWSSLSDELNAKMLKYNRELNHFYLNEPALWQLEQEDKSVRIIDADNRDQSVLSFIRQGKVRHDFLIVLLNFTPVQRDGFKVGVPYLGTYKEVLNSSRSEFGGDWTAKPQEMATTQEKFKDFDYQISVDLPGFSAMIIKPDQVTIKRKRSKKR